MEQNFDIRKVDHDTNIDILPNNAQAFYVRKVSELTQDDKYKIQGRKYTFQPCNRKLNRV